MVRSDSNVFLQIFNPPYVPTPDDEVDRGGIAKAWAGGLRGRRIIDKVLAQVRMWHNIRYLRAMGLRGNGLVIHYVHDESIFHYHQLPELLSSSGELFMVTVQENDPEGERISQ